MRVPCPICTRKVDVKDGIIPYHDDNPPLRSVCKASKNSWAGISAAYEAGVQAHRQRPEVIEEAKEALDSLNELAQLSQDAGGYDLPGSAPDSIEAAVVESRTGCDHGIVFDEEAAKTISCANEVKRRFPRLFGLCPLGCGYDGIYYASYAHYILGDW